MALIELNDVSLTFNLRQNRKVSLKEYLLKGMFLPSINPTLAIHALSQINLRVEEGERIGIIGHNGAGKSTILKLLAGVYPPTRGTCSVRGRICSLFDINVGFEMEASGWENIAYRGYLQGETPTTLKDKVQEIAEFSELGSFLDVPVRYYSAGMMVRLAFSIATAVNPEILLVDEMLSAGDLSFHQKAIERMRNMIHRSKAVVIVSHDLNSVQSLCTRVFWFQHGSIQMEGAPHEVVEAYMRSVNPTSGPVVVPDAAPGTMSDLHVHPCA
jgi:ABC-type polysaccharide/polyol phosphate transport system ATPase subunit